MDLDMNQREDILGIAVFLVPEDERRNPVLVVQAAVPLLEWAGQAASSEDLRARLRALRLHLQNTGPGRVIPGSLRKFTADAGVYYAVLTGTEEGRER